VDVSFEQIRTFFHIYIQILFLLAPFFAVSIFLMMSEGMDSMQRRKAALRTSAAILVLICVFFFFGKPLFSILGITLPAFQIGTGSVLFLTSIIRVLGIGPANHKQVDPDDDFSIVPLAIPIIVGPGTIGALLVYGTAVQGFVEGITTFLAVLAGGLTVAIFVLLAERIEQWLGHKILSMIVKVTALMLTALAAQIIFTGIKGFMAGS
jgi:multiple antibiotic resistance protein